ncbi:o-succinylbenzoate--CoA ligase [Virgibacillus sp. MG-45]|uniref:o-succinylbenzoate--CoA ligase n=1 Tax=Virgibacillus sp. MG-45 TaxID=3102791 RepID=UPI002EDB1F24
MGEKMPHWLTKQADLSPDEVAIETKDGDSLTFSELKINSQRFAQQLASIGVDKGTHVGILSSNHQTMMIALHAISYLGAVAVLLNTRLTRSELQYQVDDGDVAIVIAADSYYEKALELQVKRVISYSDIGRLSKKVVHLQEELDLDDVYTIMYTSGTTGFPKGVIHTYGNHWWSAIGSALNLGVDKHDKWLTVLPMFHVGGLSILIRSVIYGIPVYLLDKFDVQEVLEAIIHKKVSIVSVVTVMLQQIVANIGEYRFPDTFRCMLLGGGPAPTALLEKAKAHHIPVFQSYGMTETSSQIVTLAPKDALAKIGSAGKSLFPAQLKVVTEKPGQIGDIFVKGPMVTSGYYKKPTATEKAIKNGWLATGDLGYLDKDGYLYIADRRKDLIISGGENIYPSEIENILSELADIQEVGVIGQENEQWGEVPVAFIVREKKEVTKENIYAFANTRLARYKVPKEIFFVDELPRNASNKLLRWKLKELLEDPTIHNHTK